MVENGVDRKGRIGMLREQGLKMKVKQLAVKIDREKSIWFASVIDQTTREYSLPKRCRILASSTKQPTEVEQFMGIVKATRPYALDDRNIKATLDLCNVAMLNSIEHVLKNSKILEEPNIGIVCLVDLIII